MLTLRYGHHIAIAAEIAAESPNREGSGDWAEVPGAAAIERQPSTTESLRRYHEWQAGAVASAQSRLRRRDPEAAAARRAMPAATCSARSAGAAQSATLGARGRMIIGGAPGLRGAAPAARARSTAQR